MIGLRARGFDGLPLVAGVFTLAGALAIGCGKDPGANGDDGAETGVGPGPSDASADDGPGPGDGSTGNASAGGDHDDDDDDGPVPEPPVKYDLGTIPDAPELGCGGEGSDVELSYIWIANSSQGTISKIDTQTMIEEGRYRAKQFGGDPSRTSVNLQGDVAVANRSGGGVAKFWANVEDCVDVNGDGLQTSTGANDILEWGQEDCLAWYTPMNCSSNRPVAWTRGDFNNGTCTYENIKLWTVCDSQVHLLDGETGMIEQTVVVPAGAGGGFGVFVYGGAADGDGNFWGLNTGSNSIFRVDFETLDTQSWPLPPMGGYGITVDSVGRPWVCGGGSVARFNLDTSTWTSSAGGFGGIGGCMTDGAQLIWHDGQSGQLKGFDIETLAVVEQIQLPQYVHGVSVDFYGYVWGVSFAGSTAYRADPATDMVQSYAGLTGAYTYSDMTGHALSTVGGGGTPSG